MRRGPLVAVAHVGLYAGGDGEIDAPQRLTRHVVHAKLGEEMLSDQSLLDAAGLGLRLHTKARAVNGVLVVTDSDYLGPANAKRSGPR